MITNTRPIRLFLAGTVCASLGWVTQPVPPVNAATLIVTTTADELNVDGDCSLREAIIAANTDTAIDACGAGNGVDVITLPAGIYTLNLIGANEEAAATGDLDLLQPVSLVGAGMHTTIVDGAASDRVVHVQAEGVGLTGLTIRNGSSGGFSGAGIYIVDGSLTLSEVAVVDNSGNTAGIHVGLDGALTVHDSLIARNGGASAGGLFVTSGAQARLERTLIADNTVSFDGAAINTRGNLIIVNSTITGNIANTDGGGLAVPDGTVQMFNVTVTANVADNSGTGGDGGGVAVTATGVVTATNSLIGGNVDLSASGNVFTDCLGPLVSGGHTLLQSPTGCAFTGGTGSLIGIDPMLGALAANAGPTDTHALLAGSPAIDAGDPAGCASPDLTRLWVDQRGFARVTRCDIGAYETGSAGAPRWLWLPELANAALP